MSESSCHICEIGFQPKVGTDGFASHCRLCEKSVCENCCYSYSQSEGTQVLLCDKCTKRLKMSRQTHPDALLEQIQAAVFGITTVYRCPQCHGEIRFRGFFEKVSLCQKCCKLVCNDCGRIEAKEAFLCLNCSQETQTGQRLDAPPEKRCDACHAPVITQTDSRFSRAAYPCVNCARTICETCLDADKLEKTGKPICRDCIAQKTSFLGRLLKKIMK
jgi:hypothetical protein